jgi:hypothetical protein
MWEQIRVGKLFSQRKKVAPLKLSEGISQPQRNRIEYRIHECMGQRLSSYQNPYVDLARKLYGTYGLLKIKDNSQNRNSGVTAEVLFEHLILCTDDEYLDFIEIAMLYIDYNQIGFCVIHLNEIFREDGLAYVLTPFSVSDVIDDATGKRISNVQNYPQIILVDNQVTQQEIIAPVLKLLTYPGLSVVNQELIGAFHHIRDKKYADAISLAAASMESMFKVIFKREKMTLPKSTALGNLINEFLNKNKLPKYYENCFLAISKIRNEISSSHGRAEQNIDPVTFYQAEHVVHLVASNILFLARKYGLES